MRAHLQPLGSVDGPQGPENSEDSQDFHHVDGTGPASDTASESSAGDQTGASLSKGGVGGGGGGWG